MTDTSIAQNAPILVAIDIAKARHEVLIAIPGKKRRRRLTILNQLNDFERLVASLTSFNLPVRVAFEATGNYHRHSPILFTPAVIGLFNNSHLPDRIQTGHTLPHQHLNLP